MGSRSQRALHGKEPRMSSSKKILFSYENLVPSSQADAEVVFNTAGALAARGHRAVLATPAPPGLSDAFASEVRDYYGLSPELRITPVPSFTRNIAAQHAYHAWRLPSHPAFADADFIYARNPVVVMSALRAGQRVLMDHYRPWGDQFPPLQPIFRQFMTHPRFLGLVVHSEFACRSFARLGVPPEKLRVVHNGWNPQRMQPVLSKEEARAQLELPQKRRIVTYAGRVNEKKGLDILLTLADRMPEVIFLIVGSTGHGVIEREAETRENVIVAPWQTASSLAPYLYASDTLTIPPSAKPLEEVGNTVLPLKLFLYLASGRPIFAGRNPDTAEVLDHDRNAWLVSSGDVDEAQQQLTELLSDEARLQRLGQAARAQAEELTWESRAAKIESFIDERLAADPYAAVKGPWSGRSCLRESMRWLRAGVLQGRWIHQPARCEPMPRRTQARSSG